MQLNENPFNAITLGPQTTDYNSRRITISKCTYKISSSSYKLLEVIWDQLNLSQFKHIDQIKSFPEITLICFYCIW